MEERRDLGVYVLNRLLLALVRLEDFEELLVDLWLVLKTVLDFVDVADSMVKLDGPTGPSLLTGSAIKPGLLCGGGRGLSVPNQLGRHRARSWHGGSRLLALADDALLVRWAVAIKLASGRDWLAEGSWPGLSWGAELCFGAFYAVMYLRLPVPWALSVTDVGASRTVVHSCAVHLLLLLRSLACSNRVDGGARGSRDANTIRVVFQPTLYPVARRKKGVEALDEVWVAGKELRHSADNTRRID